MGAVVDDVVKEATASEGVVVEGGVTGSAAARVVTAEGVRRCSRRGNPNGSRYSGTKGRAAKNCWFRCSGGTGDSEGGFS